MAIPVTDLSPAENLWDVVEVEICIMEVHLTNPQQLERLSCQHKEKFLMNVYSNLLNLCHKKRSTTCAQEEDTVTGKET